MILLNKKKLSYKINTSKMNNYNIIISNYKKLNFIQKNLTNSIN